MIVGIIPDGNRRWAKSKGLGATVGHIYGIRNLDRIIGELLPNVDHLYVYLLAFHNYERDFDELTNLMKLYVPLIKKYYKNPKFTFQLGHPPREVGKPIDIIIRSTKGNSPLSGFFPEESANAKLIVLGKYWPAVNIEDINEALEHGSRQ